MKNASTFTHTKNCRLLYKNVLFYSIVLFLCSSCQSPKSAEKNNTNLNQAFDTNTIIYNLNQDDFNGIWSNNGNIISRSLFSIELQQIGNKIEGSLQYETWDEKGNTISSTNRCKISGLIEDKTVLIKIWDPIEKMSYIGKLDKKESYLLFTNLNEGNTIFPKSIKVRKQ